MWNKGFLSYSGRGPALPQTLVRGAPLRPPPPRGPSRTVELGRLGAADDVPPLAAARAVQAHQDVLEGALGVDLHVPHGRHGAATAGAGGGGGGAGATAALGGRAPGGRARAAAAPSRLPPIKTCRVTALGEVAKQRFYRSLLPW